MPLFGATHPSAAAAAGYVIGNSCRFDGVAGYLKKTFSGAGSTNKMTLSVWIKKCRASSSTHYDYIMSFASGGDELRWDISTLELKSTIGGRLMETDQKFRDPTAWFHLVLSYDFTQGTDTDRYRVWVNGEQVTALTGSFPTSGDVFGDWLKASTVHYLGVHSGLISTRFFDGYMAEFIVIDGTSYAATDFGEFDANGNWVPIDPSGLTFGTNGFWLDFSSAPTGGLGADAGKDVSGNNNHWTESGLAANDQTTDSPTDDADNDIGNYATISPINRATGATNALSEGNTQFASAAIYGATQFTQSIPANSGKWGWEVTYTTTGNTLRQGLVSFTASQWSNNGGALTQITSPWDAAIVLEADTAGTGAGLQHRYNSAGSSTDDDVTSTAKTVVAGDVYEYLYDSDNGTLDIKREGTGLTQVTGIPSVTMTPFIGGYTCQINIDCGQLGYTPSDSSYKTLHTGNLPAPSIKDPSAYFQAKLFTGGGTAIGSGGDAVVLGGNSTMQPDLVWIKDRDTVVEHVLTDVARGVTNELNTNDTSVEEAVAEGLTAFNADGFTTGNDASYNTSSSPNVAFCWSTQGGAGSSNTDGTINTTTTSVGTTQGMSISTYTGTGSAATIGHGLGVAPEFIIVKERTNDVGGWFVYHKDNTASPETDYLYLDTTAATVDDATVWNDTAPTTSVFSIGTHDDINASGDTYVAYCWSGIAGFSKFGTYEGNANLNGTFIYLGFRPALVICKSIDSTSGWLMFDGKREGYNVDNDALSADSTAAETTTDMIDIVSNGFKQRDTTDPNVAETYVYMAWAEHPFGGSGVSQARAR